MRTIIGAAIAIAAILYFGQQLAAREDAERETRQQQKREVDKRKRLLEELRSNRELAERQAGVPARETLEERVARKQEAEKKAMSRLENPAA